MSETTETLPVPEVTEVAPTPETSEIGKTRQMSFTVLDSGEIRADFGPGLEPLVLNPAQVPESLQASAMAEGLISRARGYTSKLVDSDRTPEALRTAVEKAFTNLLAGIWKIERVGGGASEYTIEVEAAYQFRVMRAKAQNVEYTGTLAEAAEMFAKLTPDEVKQLKAVPRYKLAYAEVKARRDAEKLAALAKKIEEDEAKAPM